MTEILLEAGKIMGVFAAGCGLVIFGVNWARGKKGAASTEELNNFSKRVDVRLDGHEKRIVNLESSFRENENRLSRIENKVDKNEIKTERISDTVNSIDKKIERICTLMEVGVKSGVFDGKRLD